jgi:hypothetical protein
MSRFCCHIQTKLSRQILVRCTIWNFTKIRPPGAEVFHTQGQAWQNQRSLSATPWKAPPTLPNQHINEESKLNIIFWTPYYHLKPGCCGLQLFDWYYRVFSFYQITKPVCTGTVSYRRKWSIRNTPNTHLLSNIDRHVVKHCIQLQSFLASEMNQFTHNGFCMHQLV